MILRYIFYIRSYEQYEIHIELKDSIPIYGSGTIINNLYRSDPSSPCTKHINYSTVGISPVMSSIELLRGK